MLPNSKLPYVASLGVSYKRRKTSLPIANVVQDLIHIKQARNRRSREESLLFFSIGLVISLTGMILLFNWKQFDSGHEVEVAKGSATVDELLDIPITQQLPPIPQKQVNINTIEAVSDAEVIEDIDLDLDLDINENMKFEDRMVQDVPLAPMEEEKAEEIFLIVEDPPVPRDGMNAFMKYIAENLHYPAQALRLNVQGKVFIQFVVGTDGVLTDFQVVKGIGAGCDEEALRVLSGAPAWIPGKQRGRSVRVRMILPVNFMLAGS